MNVEGLIAILRQGESTRVEFKSDFPSQGHAIGKEMAALANSGGGILLMGVSDDGAPIGMKMRTELSSVYLESRVPVCFHRN